MKTFLLSLILFLGLLFPSFAETPLAMITLTVTYSNQGDYRDIPIKAAIYKSNGKTALAYTVAHGVRESISIDGVDYFWQAAIVTLANGQRITAKVEHLIKGKDLAIISFDTNWKAQFKLGLAHPGEKVTCYLKNGQFNGIFGSLVNVETDAGNFSGQRTLDIPTVYGDSGSPILNLKGRLIGIVSGKKGDKSFFTPILTEIEEDE